MGREAAENLGAPNHLNALPLLCPLHPLGGASVSPPQSAWESWPKVRQAPRDCSPWTPVPNYPTPKNIHVPWQQSNSSGPHCPCLKPFKGSRCPWDEIPSPDRGSQTMWFSPSLALRPPPCHTLPLLPLWTIFSISLISLLAQGPHPSSYSWAG